MTPCYGVTYRIELAYDVKRAVFGRRLGATGDGTPVILHLVRGGSERNELFGRERRQTKFEFPYACRE